jgi:hypothetical protein
MLCFQIARIIPLFYGFALKAARKRFRHTIRKLDSAQKIVRRKDQQWPHHLEDLTMNVLKHMEAIFGAVLVLGCVAAALSDRTGTSAVSAQSASGDGSGAMPVVVVKAKRMSALEKRQSLEVESGNRSVSAGA